MAFSKQCKKTHANASILKDRRLVFNIKGNSYRLIIKFKYEGPWAFIRFNELQTEYDKINVNTI